MIVLLPDGFEEDETEVFEICTDSWLKERHFNRQTTSWYHSVPLRHGWSNLGLQCWIRWITFKSLEFISRLFIWSFKKVLFITNYWLKTQPLCGILFLQNQTDKNGEKYEKVNWFYHAATHVESRTGRFPIDPTDVST